MFIEPPEKKDNKKKKKYPKEWSELYPVGTKAGNEEARLFKALSRNTKEWRSVTLLSKDSGLTKERVEQILGKYMKLGVVFQSPKNEENFAYWERVPEMLPDEESSISDDDKKKRIDDGLGLEKVEINHDVKVVKMDQPKGLTGTLTISNPATFYNFVNYPLYLNDITLTPTTNWNCYHVGMASATVTGYSGNQYTISPPAYTTNTSIQVYMG